MTWRSFMDYVIMRELGQSDAVERNYDLEHLNGSKPGMVLDRAYERMGFDQKHTHRSLVLPNLRATMRNVGYNAPVDDVQFATLVRRWYNWDRIRKGEIRQWPLISLSTNPLI